MRLFLSHVLTLSFSCLVDAWLCRFLAAPWFGMRRKGAITSCRLAKHPERQRSRGGCRGTTLSTARSYRRSGARTCRSSWRSSTRYWWQNTGNQSWTRLRGRVSMNEHRSSRFPTIASGKVWVKWPKLIAH